MVLLMKIMTDVSVAADIYGKNYGVVMVAVNNDDSDGDDSDKDDKNNDDDDGDGGESSQDSITQQIYFCTSERSSGTKHLFQLRHD